MRTKKEWNDHEERIVTEREPLKKRRFSCKDEKELRKFTAMIFAAIIILLLIFAY